MENIALPKTGDTQAVPEQNLRFNRRHLRPPGRRKRAYASASRTQSWSRSRATHSSFWSMVYREVCALKDGRVALRSLAQPVESATGPTFAQLPLRRNAL